VVNVKKRSCIGEYSDALDLLFSNNITDDVVIRFESGGYVICLEIRSGKTEVGVYR